MKTETTLPKPTVKITNKQNLPLPFVLAVSADDSYDPGNSWRTVTELIDPPRLAFLKRKHKNDIVQDASDLVYTFQGHIVHAIVEKAAKTMKKEGWESERRIFKEIRRHWISGQFDLYHYPTGELLDVKYSTAYKAKKGQCPDEWEEQLNLLAALLRSEGKQVHKVGILLIIRDFSKLEAARDPDYPQCGVLYLKAKLWGEEECLRFLDERVRLHDLAEHLEAFCTPEERWAKPSIWAIKKRGTSRAISGGLYADYNSAETALRILGQGYEIEHRKGAYTRCEYYCSVKDFCTQYKGEKNGST